MPFSEDVYKRQYPDGTAFNTTGSDIVGLACRECGVPLYVLTPLMKLDMRPLRGFVRRLVNNNTREKMKTAGFTEQELEQVDFDCPELLPVGADTVSYTHLDVYKRQVRACCATVHFRCGAGRCSDFPG